MNQTSRIKWIDVLRCFGIVLIYLWHLRDGIGYLDQFAPTHFIALFFLVSGASEAMHSNTSILVSVKKTFTGVLIPWLYYALESLVLYIMVFLPGDEEIAQHLLHIAAGTANGTFFNHSLWFLTCLACTKIIFSFIKTVKNKALILLICFGLFYSHYAMPLPLFRDVAAYNLNQVCAHLIFYAIGYCSFPWICKILEPKTRSQRWFLLLSSLFCGGYTALLFIGKDLLYYLPYFPFQGYAWTILRPLLVVYFYCTVAKLLENIEVLQLIGRNTLHLCGSEYIISLLFPAFLGIFGMIPVVYGPWYTYFYGMALLLVNVYFLVPCQKGVLKKIYALPGWLK